MDPDRLLAIELFAGLDHVQRAAVAAVAREVRRPSGATLVQQGEVGFELFALEEGAVAVVRDGEPIASLGEGEVFGEAGVLHRGPRTASVIATSAVRLFVLTAWDLKRLARTAPPVATRLRDLLAARESG
jgi:cAMP-dependent protein kinase regulator